MALRGCERERAEPFDRRRARQKRGDAHIARRHGAEDGNGKEDGQEARVFRVYHAPQAAFRQRTVPEGGLTLGPLGIGVAERSEERSVGKEGVSTWRSRWESYHDKKKKKETT